MEVDPTWVTDWLWCMRVKGIISRDFGFSPRYVIAFPYFEENSRRGGLGSTGMNQEYGIMY